MLYDNMLMAEVSKEVFSTEWLKSQDWYSERNKYTMIAKGESFVIYRVLC